MTDAGRNTMSDRKTIRHSGGSIYRLGPGKYRAQIWHNYKRHRAQFSGEGALDQAKNWIESTQAEINADEEPLDAFEIREARRAINALPEGVTLMDAVRYYKDKHAGIEPRPLADVAETFLDDRSDSGLRPATMAQYRSHMNQLAADLGEESVTEISTRDLIEWLNEKHIRGATRGSYKASWKVFWNWCKDLSYAGENPADGIPKHTSDQVLAEIWPVETVKKFLHAAEQKYPEMCGFCALGFFAGIRTLELHRLDWSAVNDDVIHIGPQVAKKRRQRFVNIPRNLRAWIEKYRDEGPVWKLTPSPMRKRVRDVRAKAKIDDWPHNVMRHSFASYHLALWEDAPKTAHELGHTRPEILYDHYRALATKKQGAAYFSIRPRRGGRQMGE